MTVTVTEKLKTYLRSKNFPILAVAYETSHYDASSFTSVAIKALPHAKDLPSAWIHLGNDEEIAVYASPHVIIPGDIKLNLHKILFFNEITAEGVEEPPIASAWK